jgi:hypothetical protein
MNLGQNRKNSLAKILEHSKEGGKYEIVFFGHCNRVGYYRTSTKAGVESIIKEVCNLDISNKKIRIIVVWEGEKIQQLLTINNKLAGNIPAKETE